MNRFRGSGSFHEGLPSFRWPFANGVPQSVAQLELTYPFRNGASKPEIARLRETPSAPQSLLLCGPPTNNFSTGEAGSQVRAVHLAVVLLASSH